MGLSLDTLADLLPWWLEVRCACGRTTLTPIQLLAKRHGPMAKLPALVARMRCSHCGARPADAALVERPADGRPGDVQPARRPL